MTPTLATSIYRVTNEGPLSMTDFKALVDAKVTLASLQAVDTLKPFGAVLLSVATAISSRDVDVTIEHTLVAGYIVNFPNGSDQKAPLRGIYTHVIGGLLSAKVVAQDPTLS